MGRWLVSKRLAMLITTIAFAISLWYVCGSLPVTSETARRGIPTFSYESLPLKFYKGKAQILAQSGYVAYIGHVKKGTAQGSGTLYAKDETVLYKGMFSKGVYHGNGTLYRSDGTKEYKGEFAYGAKQGEGRLFNGQEQQVYKGQFEKNAIVYEKLVGVSTEEVAGHYTGKQMLYALDADICAYMPEISAFYYGTANEDSVEGGWRSEGVYVLTDFFLTEDGKLNTVRKLRQYFGKEEYKGTTVLQFCDVAALCSLPEKKREKYKEKVRLETEGEWEDARDVTDFTRNVESDIHTFQKGDFQYTFFTYEKAGEFCFYLIEAV